MKRSFGYDPGVSWQIIDIHESAFPGIAEIIVSVNKGGAYHLYLVSGQPNGDCGPDAFLSGRILMRRRGPS